MFLFLHSEFANHIDMNCKLGLCLSGLFLLSIQGGLASIATIDQQNSIANGAIGWGAVNFQLGQSFTPTLTSMSVAEFGVSTQPGYFVTMRLDVFAGTGFTGSLLGSSAPVTFSNPTSQMIEFNLLSPIILVPGQVYTLSLTSGPNAAASCSSNNPYAGGNLFTSGPGSGLAYDLVFAEGIPEPSTNCLLLFGVAAILWRIRARVSRGRV